MSCHIMPMHPKPMIAVYINNNNNNNIDDVMPHSSSSTKV